MSTGTPYKCSVTHIDIDRLGEVDEDGNTDNGAKSEKAFHWDNIKRKYSSRDLSILGDMDVFTYCSRCWEPNRNIVPQFFGYLDKATWPLDETYSKWTLILFKPWKKKAEEVKGSYESYAEALEAYMKDDNCRLPARKLNEILRAKRNEKSIDLDAGDEITGVNHFTPTDEDERQNEQYAEAVEAADLPSNHDDHSDEFEDMDEALHNRLNSRIPENFDWSQNFDEAMLTALPDYKTKFYDEQTKSILHQKQKQTKLIDEHIFRPENASTKAQKFLAFHHLHHHYLTHQYETGQREEPPPMQNVFVEGLPGVGKTFVIRTVSNMTKVIKGRNDSVMVSAPTGCAASLIDGSTHNRSLTIPVGKELFKAPSNIKTTNANAVKAKHIATSSVHALLKDEHSMDGLPTWGWIEHRTSEFRSSECLVIDKEGNVEVVQIDESFPTVPEEISNRPFGGIPYIMSSGDTNQLPPVGMKAIYDTKSTVKAGSANGVGKIVLSNFLNPVDPTEAQSTIVMMDEVIRQKDPKFLDFLSRMRRGCLDDEDADFIFKKCLDQMDPDDCIKFKDALHLVPVWKMAHQIIFDYLQHGLETPIAKMCAKTHTCRSNGKNCCIGDTNLPLRNALCVGAKVMLLTNFIVEHKLMNGSIGVIVDICYDCEEGPSNPNAQMYVVVDFEDSTLPEPLIPGKPSTWVPIPVITQQCEKRCCSVTAIPLRVCKALSAHKSQGMSIGPGNPFKYLVIHLPDPNSKFSCPGLELVEWSRATSPDIIAIGNESSSLTKEAIRKIGRTPAYDARRVFQETLRMKSAASQEPTINAIKSLDPSPANKTYEGGCKFLLDWYRSTFPIENAHEPNRERRELIPAPPPAVQRQQIVPQQNIHQSRRQSAVRQQQEIVPRQGSPPRHRRRRRRNNNLNMINFEIPENDRPAFEFLLNTANYEEIEASRDRDREDVVVINHGRYSIKLSGFSRFQDGCWLSDESINYFLKNLVQPSHEHVHFYTSYFFNHLVVRSGLYNFDEVIRWHNPIEGDLFQLDSLFIPINRANEHWLLLHIQPQLRRVRLYDSLGPDPRNEVYLQNIMRYLFDVASHLGQQVGRFRAWKRQWDVEDTRDDSPRQGNTYDCGIFTILNAALLANGSTLDATTYTQHDINHSRARERIAYKMWSHGRVDPTPNTRWLLVPDS